MKNFLKNKWFKFILVSVAYILWLVVWTGNWWMLLGVPVIYDIYISKCMARYVFAGYRKKKKESRPFKKTMEWVEAILFATVAAMLIRGFFIEMYVIPSPSMEKTLLVGDYLCVSKATYGPKMPNTPLSFPLVHNTMPLSNTKSSFVEWIKRPYKRLAGLRSVERDDVVVFNFPEGDTVALANPQQSYYDLVRAYGREMVWQQSKVIYRPVDKRDNYVKRCVALPGDSLKVVEGQVYVNGVAQKKIEHLQYNYFVKTNGTPINQSVFEEMDVTLGDITLKDRDTYDLPLTEAMAARLQTLGNVVSVTRHVDEFAHQGVFPHSYNYRWTSDYFGPLWVPKKGATVGLTVENLPLYERIISVYEANKLEVKDSTIFINGAPADSYTFKMDYYFMMGDNRHNSLDSRYWGFVPEDHVVGTPVCVWLSLDRGKSFPGNIRFSRIFKFKGI